MDDKIFYDNEYVLWLEFDENTTTFLNSKCEALAEQEIEPGVRPPHLTLSFIRSDNEKELKELVIHFFDKVKELSFTLNSVGAFSGGVLFYGPKVTIELLQLHKNLCQVISETADLSWDLYVPGKWTPHIALTGGLSKEDAKKAFTIMMSEFESIKTSVVSVKLRRLTTGKEIVNYSIENY